MKNQIFISHASIDKKLVDKFVDLIDTGCGIPRSDIFCTSLEGMGVPAGSDFLQFIKSKLVNPSMVIMMLSPNYYNSVFCLCELGASWALSSNISPIVIEPLQKRDIKEVLSVTQLSELASKSDLDSLRDKIIELYKIKGSPTATWNVKRDQFLKELPEIISNIPKADRVSRTSLEESENNYREALKQLSEKNEEIEEFKNIIEELKQCKDAEEVSSIEQKYSTEWEQFESLSNSIRKKLIKLPKIVPEVIYYDFICNLLIRVSQVQVLYRPT